MVDLNAVHTPNGTIAIVTDDLGYEGADETGKTLKKTGTEAATGDGPSLINFYLRFFFKPDLLSQIA